MGTVDISRCTDDTLHITSPDYGIGRTQGYIHITRTCLAAGDVGPPRLTSPHRTTEASALKLSGGRLLLDCGLQGVWRGIALVRPSRIHRRAAGNRRDCFAKKVSRMLYDA